MRIRYTAVLNKEHATYAGAHECDMDWVLFLISPR
jgi:hypothetical protein